MAVYKDKQDTWDARPHRGVFAVYKMKNGYEWAKRYIVRGLGAFLDVNLKVSVVFHK